MLSAKTVDCLYSKYLMVTLKHERNIETTQRRLRILIKIEWHTYTSPSARKELLVRLVDENDFLLLYNVLLTEDDFARLKQQQNILVDFGTLPWKLINFFDQSLQEEHSENPKIFLQLTRLGYEAGNHQGTLDVIALTNGFSKLVQFSLKLVEGSAEEIKQYLIECLKISQDCKSKVENTLKVVENDLQSRLARSEEVLSSRTAEFELSQRHMNEQISALKEQHAQEMEAVRQNALKEQCKLRLKLEKQIRDIESTKEQNDHQYQSEMKNLTEKNTELKENLAAMGCQKEELRRQLESLNVKAISLQSDVRNLEQRNTALEATMLRDKEHCNHLEKQVAELELDVRSKVELMVQDKALLSKMQDEKENVIAEVEEKRKSLSKKESTLKHMKADLGKANEIIQKLRNDLKEKLYKVEVEKQTIKKHEKTISEKEIQIQKLEEDETSLRDKLLKTESEMLKVKIELESTSAELSEQEAKLKEKTETNKWLSKQLTEKRMMDSKQMVDTQAIDKLGYSAFHQLRMGALPVGATSYGQRMVGSPMASSTPQVYSLVPIPANYSPLETSHLSKDKENDAPLDPKYLVATQGTNDDNVHLNANPYRSKCSAEQPTKVPFGTNGKKISVNENRAINRNVAKIGSLSNKKLLPSCSGTKVKDTRPIGKVVTRSSYFQGNA